jgi:DNA-directed RNA polymerase beta' subunit
MITSDNISDDDLSISLVEIIKSNNLLKSGTNLSDEKYEKVLADIKFRTLTYCDNSRGKAVHNTNHKPLSGIKERITKKTGHIRQNLMGKRRDKTFRSVLGPDSTLMLNEVAIPPEIASVLTMPVYVNNVNRDELCKLVNTIGKASTIKTTNNNGKTVTKSVPTMIKQVAMLATNDKRSVPQHGDTLLRDGQETIIMNCKTKLRPGDRIKPYKKKDFENITFTTKQKISLNIGDQVEFFLKDGDFVLLNRQPTLHKSSMQAMKVVIKPGKTIRINLALTAGYNMDFDGVTMDF